MSGMKDSGIRWIGEYPQRWGLVALKRYVKVHNGVEILSEVSADTQNSVPVYGSGGVFKHTAHVQYEGEAVLFGRKGTLGKPIYASGKMWAVDTMYLLSHNGMLSPRYNYYQLSAFNWDPWITQTAIPSIVASDIVAQKFPMPHLPEQHRITKFLDQKCADIDNVIEKTKASVEEYKRLKQSVITEAVTKGIRGERSMKDSGCEWFGEIPDIWHKSRVGLHHNIILGKMLCSEPKGEDYSLEKYFCAADVHFDGIAKNDYKSMWFSDTEKELYRVRQDDLLIVEGGAGAGGCAIVGYLAEPFYIQNSIMIVRPRPGSSSRYLRYYIESIVKRGYIDIACNKATIPHFTKDKLGNVPIPLPPLEEQQEIAEYLDKKCSEIDSLIASKEKFIAELESYKKSLIYEYVTGKKEVPNTI